MKKYRILVHPFQNCPVGGTIDLDENIGEYLVGKFMAEVVEEKPVPVIPNKKTESNTQPQE